MNQVTLSFEDWAQLLRDQEKLYALEDAGVDNWCGYDLAMASISKTVSEE